MLVITTEALKATEAWNRSVCDFKMINMNIPLNSVIKDSSYTFGNFHSLIYEY